MKTDIVFYRLFKDHPEVYFELLGQDPALGRNYRFESLELKQINLRIDGVFIPNRPELPVEFLEVQFYRNPAIYANLLAKVFLDLERNRPEQLWRATALFGTRRMAPRQTAPYESVLQSGQLVPLFLDDIDARPGDSIGLSIMRLVTDSEAVIKGAGCLGPDSPGSVGCGATFGADRIGGRSDRQQVAAVIKGGGGRHVSARRLSEIAHLPGRERGREVGRGINREIGRGAEGDLGDEDGINSQAPCRRLRNRRDRRAFGCPSS